MARCRHRYRGTMLLMAALAFGPALPARAGGGALATVLARHELRCGVYADVPPFSSPDPVTRELAGMDIDLCRALAGQLAVRPRLVPLSVESRIAELQMGRVDVLVANLAYSRSRAKQIAFSDSYYIAREELVLHREDPATGLAQIRGERISTTRGSTSEQSVRVNHGVPVSYLDTGAAYLALQQYRVRGFVTNNVTAHKLIRQVAADGVQLRLLEQPMALEPIAVGLRKGEPDLLGHLDKALQALEANGQLDRIWNRWLGPGTVYDMRREDKVTDIGQLSFEPLP